jgi:VWFA-related protein
MSIRLSVTPLLLTVLLFGGLGAGQVSDIPTITIKSNTRLVTVDVVVTTRKGAPLTGLKPEHFTVEENGKKQKISVFVPPGAIDHASHPGPPPGMLSNHPEAVERGPATVLILDAANSRFEDQSYARSQMLKYAAEAAHLEQGMAVFTLTNRLRVLQSFTGDPDVLYAAIKNFRPQEPPSRPANAAQGSSGTNDLGLGMPASIAMVMAEIRNFQNMQVEADLERRTLITVDAMQSLARILAGFPGRKNVIWLASNFPFELIPEIRDAAEQHTLHIHEVRLAEAQLAAAGIAIYPVDIRGLISKNELAEIGNRSTPKSDILGTRDRAEITNPYVIAELDMSSAIASQGTMREIASETGGRAYLNQNEIKDAVNLALADYKASYTLGYYPQNRKWDEKYRKIKVRVDERDTAVRYRKGYFAIDAAQQTDREHENDIATALELGVPATQVLFMAQADHTDPGKMRVVFFIDVHILTAEDAGGGEKMNVSVYASVCDGHGKNLETRGTKVDRTFDAATYQQILAKGMMVPIDMEIPPGGQELRLAVLDNKTGFIGTASGPLGQ